MRDITLCNGKLRRYVTSSNGIIRQGEGRKMSIKPESIDIETLPSVSMSERFDLPIVNGVYFVLGSQGEILYIGKAANLRKRWYGHHLLENRLRLATCKIAWLLADETILLDELEDACIAHFSPQWNKILKRQDSEITNNALRQRRFRERRKAQEPVRRTTRPKDRRSRIQRWQDHVQGLRDIQEAYQEWLDNLPESLQETTLAERLQEVCDLDLDVLEVELPKGFGRD